MTKLECKQNVKKLYYFGFFWMFLVIIPVLVPYFINLGLNMRQIFQLQAIFGISVAIMELPSGYLCDIWGRKNTIVLGSFLAGVGYTLLVTLNNFEHLVFYEILVACSLSLISGADISLLFDSCHEEKEVKVCKKKILANLQLYKTSAESIASIIGGVLVLSSFSHVLVTQALISWIPFFIALTLKEPPYIKMPRSQHLENFKNIWGQVFKTSYLRLIFLNLVIWGLATYTAVWIFQKYWMEQGINIAYFGLLWAGHNIVVGVVGKFVPALERRYGFMPMIIFASFLPIIGYLGMAYLTGWMGIAIGLSFKVARSINQVLLNDAFNANIPGTFRATANSLVSLFFRLGFFILGPLVGYGIDKFGISFTLSNLGFFFLLLNIVIVLPLSLVTLRAQKQPPLNTLANA